MGGERRWICDIDGALAEVRIASGRATVSIAAASEAEADRALERLRAVLPEPCFESRDPRIPFLFSWKTSHGFSFRSQTLSVAPWSEMRGNYAAATAQRLDGLLADFRSQGSGQTIIWHGAPGTGKTHALRALALAWREWCDVQIVTDPDQLFGADASYLMELMNVPVRGDDGRHRLVVLEDAGELLARDARSHVGQGLSRFLNVCDGLLGQAEPVTMLVTTNEPLRSLHPAVRRPGRCAAQVEFVPLATDEANAWLAERCEARVVAPTPLCDLFALARGTTPIERRQRLPVGFAAAVEG